jgi:Ca2+-binding RTX toxin-like protein
MSTGDLDISSVSSPRIDVSLTGTNAVVGDVLKVLSSATSGQAGSTVKSVTLTADDISAGLVTVTTGSLGADGSKYITAGITDVAGNVGAVSSELNYQLDSTNENPTVTFGSATSTGFTFTVTDADVEPDFADLSLVVTESISGLTGTTSLNNGTASSIGVVGQTQTQTLSLFVSDLPNGSNQTAVTSGGNQVVLVLGKDSVNITDSAAGVQGGYGLYYGFRGNDVLEGGDLGNTIFGGAGDDTIFGGTSSDVIFGGDGADQLTGGAGADTFTFEATSNGLDTIKDFSDTEGDILDLDAIITGGEYNTAGTAITDGSTGAIALADVNDRFVYFQVGDVTSATIDEASLFAGDEFAAEGTTAGIEFILAVGEASGTDGVNLYQVTDGAGEDDMSITQIVSIEGNSLADILTANPDVA